MTATLAKKIVGTHLTHVVDRGLLDLPLLPEVAGVVMSLTSDPDADIRQLTEVINRDQAMAGHLLRLSNSPLYAGQVAIVSLQQAISRLGLKKLGEIALLITCENRVFKVDGFEKEVRALFRHSIAAASFAQEIARSRRGNVEEAFLGGLLHDIGRPLLLQEIVDFKKNKHMSLEDAAVYELAAEHHAEAGARLAESWKLSPRIIETIRYHHNPLEATRAKDTAMIVAFADELSHLAVGPRPIDEEEVRNHPMIEPLNLYPDDIAALLIKMDTICESVDAIT